MLDDEPVGTGVRDIMAAWDSRMWRGTDTVQRQGCTTQQRPAMLLLSSIC